jgi:hypothetical protein
VLRQACLFACDERVDAHRRKQSDGEVVGCLADAVAEAVAEAQADQRHQHLEADEGEADAKPILAGQAHHADRCRHRVSNAYGSMSHPGFDGDFDASVRLVEGEGGRRGLSCRE